MTGRLSRSSTVQGTVATLVFFVLTLGASGAVELEDRLIIVTSFPKPIFSRFQDAFEERHPHVQVKVLNKKTSAAISFIQQRSRRSPDLFWASSPDAFEVLKQSGHLLVHRPRTQGIPSSVGEHAVNDPDGYYTGFALSGYGLMWNTGYLEKHGLPAPQDWLDLTKAAYFGHIGISAPSRSGTTHVAVEMLLQREGWEKGWAAWLEVGGNLATVTARSYGVPAGVNKGRFGVGVVIDFFGLSAIASGFPVVFAYPSGAVFLPANVALVDGAEHPRAAEAFIDFLLSAEGQSLLFEPSIRRLPVRPAVYALAPANYPNPFEKTRQASGQGYDSALSQARYHLVNALFDQMITFRLKSLNRTWSAIHEAEALLSEKYDSAAAALISQARQRATAMPMTGRQSEDPTLASDFSRVKRGIPLSPRQAGLQKAWEAFSRRNLSEAFNLAVSAHSILRRGKTP